MNSERSLSITSAVARRRASFVRGLAHALCAALFVFSFVGVAGAQSGRRVQRPTEIPPVPTPTPLPEAKKPVREAAKKITLLVLADSMTTMQTSSTAQSIVMQTFGQRLREESAFEINAESARSSRGEASRRAKAETERFVVWIALRTSGIDNDPGGMRRPNPENYHIEYGVFAPVTGKSISSGTVYLRPGYGSIGGVRVGAPSCYPATYAYEYEFVYAAIDAANRVMKAFNLIPPPLCGR
ncbi:MAG TPA: hypothetical protein VM864_16200 [Pyrinomonadaceae bacterium]|jgi:hypothetical protein|nr:hypothetical protein [Pyrinomonadaceae bacterium]